MFTLALSSTQPKNKKGNIKNLGSTTENNMEHMLLFKLITIHPFSLISFFNTIFSDNVTYLLTKCITQARLAQLHSYTLFLFRSVGTMETKPMRKSTDNVLKSYRSLIDFRSPRARPA